MFTTFFWDLTGRFAYRANNEEELRALLGQSNEVAKMRMFLVVMVLLLQGCGWGQRTTDSSASVPTITPLPAQIEPPAADTALERKVFYYPDNQAHGSLPKGVDILEVHTPDGLRLKAWYLAPPDDAYTLLYFHGNGGNLTSLGGLFEDFRQAGLGVFAIDYRGFGESEGDPSEEGLYVDGLAAFDKAESLKHGKGLVLFGRSLGGGVASYVAKSRPGKALILESTFTSAKEVARFSHGQRGADAIEAYDNLSHLKNIKLPVFLLHGRQDDTIPAFMSEELHKFLPDSELWIVERAGHNNLRSIAGEEYSNRLKAFLAKVEESTPPERRQ